MWKKSFEVISFFLLNFFCEGRKEVHWYACGETGEFVKDRMSLQGQLRKQSMFKFAYPDKLINENVSFEDFKNLRIYPKYIDFF